MAADTRSHTSGRFSLDIDGWNVGFLKKFSGLGMEADVVMNDLGTANVQKKHVSNIKWTPGKATFGIGMGKGMYDWIQSAFDKNFLTKSGTLRAADFNYKSKSELTFHGGLITSVTVPKLDGSSKDAAYFDLEFEAEMVRWAPGDDKDIKGKIGPKQKAWLCSNFEVKIGDEGSTPCKRVASVDSFTWKCSVVADQIGIHREPTKHPAKVTVPEIKLAISHADHDPWSQAAKKWFVDGFHLEGNEMQGEIKFLDPNMDSSKPLGSVSLIQVGFKKFTDDDLEANSEKIKRFNVELYVEEMKFKIDQYDA